MQSSKIELEASPKRRIGRTRLSMSITTRPQKPAEAKTVKAKFHTKLELQTHLKCPINLELKLLRRSRHRRNLNGMPLQLLVRSK